MTHLCALETKQILDIPEVAKKIRLENIFKRELRPLFMQILRDYRTSVAAFGRAQDASRYEPVFQGLLQRHYDRVQRAFKGEIVEQNGGKALFRLLIKQDEDKLNALVDLALFEWRNQNAEEKAALITATNQRQLNQGVTDARNDFREREEQSSPRALATVAAVLVGRQFRVRSNTISQTETQEAAESTKQIQATAVAGKPIPELGPAFVERPDEVPDVTKTWITIGDDRVRPSHIAVNRTTLEEDGIFNVGQSRLRFPGDTSLLADIRETVNCRCSSQYKLK